MTAPLVLPVQGPLDLASSLASGQCFRWRIDDQGRWTGILGRNIVRLTPVPVPSPVMPAPPSVIPAQAGTSKPSSPAILPSVMPAPPLRHSRESGNPGIPLPSAGGDAQAQRRAGEENAPPANQRYAPPSVIPAEAGTSQPLSRLPRSTEAGTALLIESAPIPPGEMAEAVAAYLRLDDDLAAIQDRIGWDEHVRSGIDAYPGMRVLRQEPWEALASFILSSTSNIPRISRTVELLSETFSDPVELDGVVRHTFPTPARLAEAGEARLRELGCGFRAPYLAGAAAAVASGDLSLASLRLASYEDALASLVALHGVGEKIADCVMLFSLDKMQAFPNDRWVVKALHEWYSLPSNAKYGAMREWAWERFGNDAGYANQYLFWNVRQSTRPLRSTATI